MMGRTHEERLFRYVKDGRLKRLRSLLNKHKVDLNFQDGKKRTALHVACILGEDAIVNILLLHGARKDVKDMDGNTPLHHALKYALQVLEKRVYDDLILPLLHSDPLIEYGPNDEGETPKLLIKRFKRDLKRKRKDRKAFEEEKEMEREKARERKEWNERLFFELGSDEAEMTGFNLLDNDNDLTRETYDEWADRIERERYFTKKKEKIVEEQIRIEKEREEQERTRVLEEEHRKYLNGVCEKRKQLSLRELRTDYETRCNTVFLQNTTNELSFDDIPWPCKGTLKEMIDLISKWSDDYGDGIKYVKEQQIRWHPDRFFQKCGDRLRVEEKEMILDGVKQLSQGINIMLDV